MGTYRLPFPCEWSGEFWRNAKTGDAIEGTLRLFDKAETSTPWTAARTGGRAASIDPSAGTR